MPVGGPGEGSPAADAADAALVVVNAPHNPTRHAARSSDVRRPRGGRRGGGRAPADGRGLSVPRVRRCRPAPDRRRRHRPRGVARRHVQVVRDGWAADRLVGHPRCDLLARCAAFKDYTTICASAPSEILALIRLRCATPSWAGPGDIVAANLERLDVLRGLARSVHMGAATCRSVGFPRLTVPGVGIDDWAAGLVQAEERLAPPGSQFGYGGNHFRRKFGRTDLPEASSDSGCATRTLRLIRATRRVPPETIRTPPRSTQSGTFDAATAGLARMHRCVVKPSAPATETGATTFSLRNGGRKAQPAVPVGGRLPVPSARAVIGRSAKCIRAGTASDEGSTHRALRRGGLGRPVPLPSLQPRCPSRASRHRGRIADVRRRVSEHGSGPVGDTVTLTARVYDDDGALSTSTSSHVRFWFGVSDPNDIDSPGSSPDLDCMTGTAGACTVSYVAANSGTDTIMP